jgi:hypothetical protein
LFLIFAFYFSYKGLNFWVNKFLILDPNDIRLLQEIKNQIKNNELCLGKNDMGLYYGGIVMWYLRKNIFFSPDCLENQSLKYALVFHHSLEILSRRSTKISKSKFQTNWLFRYFLHFIKMKDLENFLNMELAVV